MNTEQEQQEQQPGEDLGSIVADVFGFDSSFGEEAAETGAASPHEPSVGTEGGAAVGTDGPLPAAAPSPVESGAGSAAPVQQPSAAPASAEAGQQAPAPQTPTVDPAALEMQSLKARLEAAEAALAQANQPPADGQPGAGQQGGQPDTPVEPINVQLPQPMMEAILSEDPQQAAQGINGLVSLIATGLNHRFRAQMAQLETRMAAQVQGITSPQQEAAAAADAEQKRNDYFAAFPQHNKPVFMPILAQEAEALAAQYPGVAWDENFRNTLGARVTAKLQEAGVVLGPGNPQATQTPVQAAPARPAAMLPTGARPAPADDDSNLVADTFKFG